MRKRVTLTMEPATHEFYQKLSKQFGYPMSRIIEEILKDYKHEKLAEGIFRPKVADPESLPYK